MKIEASTHECENSTSVQGPSLLHMATHETKSNKKNLATVKHKISSHEFFSSCSECTLEAYTHEFKYGSLEDVTLLAPSHSYEDQTCLMTDNSVITLALSNAQLDEQECESTPNTKNIKPENTGFDAIDMLDLDTKLDTTEAELEIELLTFTDTEEADLTTEDVELISF